MDQRGNLVLLGFMGTGKSAVGRRVAALAGAPFLEMDAELEQRIRVLTGMLQGLFSFATFFLIVAEIIERAGTGPTLLLAVVVALALQGVAAWLRLRARNG